MATLLLMRRALALTAEMIALLGITLMLSLPFGYDLDPVSAPRVLGVFGPALVGLAGVIDPEGPRRLLRRLRLLPS